MPSLAGLFFYMDYKIENTKQINVTKPLKLDCGQTIKDFPIAYENQNKILSLPIYPEISKKQIKFVTNSILEFYNVKNY